MPQRQLASGKAANLVACAVKLLILTRVGILGGVWGCKHRKGLAPQQRAAEKGLLLR